MSIQTKKDGENRESDVFIPNSVSDEIKLIYSDSDAVTTHRSIEELVKNFSLFQLHELSESILSDLKAYYARSIMREEKNADPALERIKDWETKYEQLALIQRDGSNFSSREKMEELIVNYAPLLRKQYE